MQCLQIIDLFLRPLDSTAAAAGGGDGGGGGGGGELGGELRFPDGDLDPVPVPLFSLVADRASALWLLSHMFDEYFLRITKCPRERQKI